MHTYIIYLLFVCLTSPQAVAHRAVHVSLESWVNRSTWATPPHHSCYLVVPSTLVQQPATGAPYPCPQVNCTVMRQAKPAIILTAVAMVRQCMTKLIEVSHSKYLPDFLKRRKQVLGHLRQLFDLKIPQTFSHPDRKMMHILMCSRSSNEGMPLSMTFLCTGYPSLPCTCRRWIIKRSHCYRVN